VIVLLGFITVN